MGLVSLEKEIQETFSAPVYRERLYEGTVESSHLSTRNKASSKTNLTALILDF